LIKTLTLRKKQQRFQVGETAQLGIFVTLNHGAFNRSLNAQFIAAVKYQKQIISLAK